MVALASREAGWNIVDIIVPPGTSQESVLKDYNVLEGRPAQLPGVVPAEVKK